MREACLHAETLRHSYASLLTKAGVPLQVVASALGHADARMTAKHYAHLAPSHIAKAMFARLPNHALQYKVSDDPKAFRWVLIPGHIMQAALDSGQIDPKDVHRMNAFTN